jgi:hypothetical protein
MSETAATPPAAMADEAADQRALAQVEKWMALIREFSGERQAQAAAADETRGPILSARDFL